MHNLVALLFGAFALLSVVVSYCANSGSDGDAVADRITAEFELASFQL